MADRLAQTISFCQLCDKNAIRWKCVECSDLFCDECKKIHERGKATRKHKIVAVKDLNEELLAHSGLNLECSVHHFVCSMFCATCNMCACANCVTDNHTGHTFQDLKALLDKKKKEIRTALTNIESSYIAMLQTEKQSMPIYTGSHEKHIENLKKEIEQRGTVLKSAVDEIMKHHISELSRFSKDRREKFSKYDADISKQLKEFQGKLLQLKKLIQPQNLTDVCSLVTMTNISTTQPSIISDFGKLEFFPGRLRPADIQREFGSFAFSNTTSNQSSSENYVIFQNETATVVPKQDLLHNNVCFQNENSSEVPNQELFKDNVNTTSLPSDHELKILNTNLSSVTSICLAQLGKLWVGCANTRKLEFLDESGNPADLPPVMTNVLGFCMSSDGDLFVTDIENCKVRRRDQSSGKLTLVKDFKPKFPISIYANVQKKSNIYVGLIDSFSKLKEDYETVSGSIVKMSDTGEILQAFGNSRTRRAFTVPNRITLNYYSKCLLVIDSVSPESGRIVALSEDDTVQFTYNPGKNHTANLFNPSDFVCTKSGAVIICDGGNSILHILDHHGLLLQCVETKSRGIDRPWSLSLYGDKRLYIGALTYKGGKQTKEAQRGVVYVTDLCLQ